MAQKTQWYIDQAKDMVEMDKNRDIMFLQQDDMWRINWELPSEMRPEDWIRKVESTDGHDALRAGTRVLSALDERIKYLPTENTAEEREKCARISKALKWHVANAARRRRTSIRRDLVMSALRYDEICAKVIFLPEHLKQIKDLGGDTKRIKAAMRYGPFAIVAENPRSVHTRYSDLMPEAVCEITVEPLHEIVSFWGKAADDVKKKMESDSALKYGVKIDYMDHGERCVVVHLQEHDKLPEMDALKKAIEIIPPMDHKLKFLPWVCRTGGTTLEADAKDQRVPLLYSIYDYWTNQCILQTILMSEVLAYAASPRAEITGPNPDSVEVQHGEPNQPVTHDAQHQYNILVPPQIDAAVATLEQFFGGAIEKATVAKILQGGAIPAGTAYATLNLATLTALGTLKPYKELAELAAADICTNMLLWVHYSGKGVKALDPEPEKQDEGKVYEIKSEDIDPDNINIRVELEPDLPIDRQQRINAASTAVERLGVGRAWAMEQVGITDPAGEIERGRVEQLEDYYFQKGIELDRLQVQLTAQQAQMAMQMQQQQAMQQQAPAQQQMAQPGQPEGIPSVEGAPWDPAQRGLPPAMAQPDATREMQQARAGAEGTA